jgi:hypothetical protein
VILLVFKVTNNNSAGSGVCDVAVYADSAVGGSSSHCIGPVPNVRGVYWPGLSSGFFDVLSVVGSGYPLTREFGIGCPNDP